MRGVTDSATPALVLSGSYDGQTGAASGQYVAQRLSHATVVTVPGVGHAPTLDEPEAVAGIERLLGRV